MKSILVNKLEVACCHDMPINVVNWLPTTKHQYHYQILYNIIRYSCCTRGVREAPTWRRKERSKWARRNILWLEGSSLIAGPARWLEASLWAQSEKPKKFYKYQTLRHFAMWIREYMKLSDTFCSWLLKSAF